MAILFDASNYTTDPIFDKEIDCAIKWLMKVQDKEKHGWGWIQNIPMNVQNTAEVVCALLIHSQRLTKELRHKLFVPIKNFLLVGQCKKESKEHYNHYEHAKITIDWVWVLRSLQIFEQKLNVFEDVDADQATECIAVSKKMCIEWLVENQNEDGGWADTRGGLSSTARTSLVIAAFSKEQGYDAIVMERAVKWLIRMQNSDGGWGNVRKEEITSQYKLNNKNTDSCSSLSEIPYENIECQYLSNPACSGYAVLALNSLDAHGYNKRIKKGIEYIKKKQCAYGGWPVFCEVGLREGVTFTFRHFSTSWALSAMLESELCTYTDECIMNGVEYLLTLQDQIYGGWKSSPDSDSYTWSTCNALELIGKVQNQFKEIKADYFLYIVKDWWKLKNERNVHSWSVAKKVFTFNLPVWILFCITYTFLLLTWDIILILNTGSIFTDLQAHQVILKVIKAAEGFVIAILLGIPWIVLLKHAFKKEMTWLSSISWVYGIVTGLLIAFYGFIIN